MYFDSQTISNNLSREDVIKICNDLGNGVYQQDNAGNLIFNTQLCHESGDSMKLYAYENKDEKRRWSFHCYTCGDTYDIFELVIRARRNFGVSITFPQAVKYVASITNNVFYKKENTSLQYKIDDWDWINKIKSSQNKKNIPQLSEISEHILEIFCPYPHETWLDEGISKQSMEKYQISYWGEQNKIIIPHRDINGRLIGIRGRALNQSDLEAKRKYMPITIEGKVLKHTLGNNLYGLCQNEEAIRRIGKIVLFESEKSVLMCDTYYNQNNFSVAVCGSNITDTQCKMILSLGVREVMIAFDKEYQNHESRLAEIYFNKLVKLANKLNPYCTVYLLMDTEDLLEQKDSPADKGKEILERLMKNKIEIRKEDSYDLRCLDD